MIIAGSWFGSVTGVNYYETSVRNNLASYIAVLGAILSSAGFIFFAYFGFGNIVNIIAARRRIILQRQDPSRYQYYHSTTII
jgi:amino acid transporter